MSPNSTSVSFAAIIFFLSVALTSGAMLIERNEGMLERCLVSGITGMEILFSHVVTQFLIMFGQSLLVLLFSFSVFDLTLNGDTTLVVVLTILTGLCGMCFGMMNVAFWSVAIRILNVVWLTGFVVSSACDNERTATYMAMGSFLPIVMLCGIIWPIEGMYPGLKYLALFVSISSSNFLTFLVFQHSDFLATANQVNGVFEIDNAKRMVDQWTNCVRRISVDWHLGAGIFND